MALLHLDLAGEKRCHFFSPPAGWEDGQADAALFWLLPDQRERWKNQTG